MDIITQNLKKPVDVAEYLFTRLHQMGVRSVHGLPGDYNLVALDYLPQTGLKWVGSVNELNAAYAADGYARVTGIGAIITTFGVGELSALNGIAGAYSEMVPVVHIVGCPSTVSQRNGMLLHHTLGNGDFNVFADMSAKVSCAVAKLNDPSDIAAQIDATLRQCWIKSRPVYVMLPTDMVTAKVEGERLAQKIDLEMPENEQEREDYVVDVVLKYLHQAQRPVVLVDACCVRHRVAKETQAFIDKTGLPVFTTPMGKGAINETHGSFGGVYAGDASSDAVKDMVEGSDLVLSVGSLKSDFNTAGFSYRMSQLNTIEFHSEWCTVKFSEYPAVRMRGVLRKVTEKVDLSQLKVQKVNKTLAQNGSNSIPASLGDSQTIIQEWFWRRMSGFLKENDIVITETGTANFGIWDTEFPQGVVGISQVLWGSIGWAVGACQGAALGAKDMGDDRRTVLFEGDGSFQLTAQELSTMIRHKLNVVLFLINNDGYTIERFIHGMEAEYNDIVMWDYKELVTVFCGKEEFARKYSIKTRDELEKLLTDEDFNNFKGLRFVEVYMPKEDAPRSLMMTAEASAKNNAKTA